MREREYRALGVLIVAAFSVAALAGFTVLLVHDPAAGLGERLPGEDGRPANLPPAPTVLFGKYFLRGSGVPSSITASWPCFRGPDRDNTSRETVSLVTPGPDLNQRVLWQKTDLGEGYAGAAVANGRVYVLDYDEARQADALRCFSLDDGRDIWRQWYFLGLKPNHGYSRTVPAVSGRYVVTIGPNCKVMCCDALSGNFLWGKDLLDEHEFGAACPLWYTGQCPLIDGSQAVIAVGGPQTLLMGVDLATGSIAWRTPNARKLAMSHSSIMLATINGVRTYVYAAIGGIVGVSAEPSSRGTLLWDFTDFAATTILPSPVVFNDGKIFATAGYGAGSIMLRVSWEGTRFVVREFYRCEPDSGFTCYQQTPILYKGMLIGILPADATARRFELACWDPDEQRFVWTSGKGHRFGWGPFMVADGKIIILNDDGVLSMAEASTEGYRPLGGSARILEGPEAWAPMALVAGRLIARDGRRMVCVDLRKKG